MIAYNTKTPSSLRKVVLLAPSKLTEMNVILLESINVTLPRIFPCVLGLKFKVIKPRMCDYE